MCTGRLIQFQTLVYCLLPHSFHSSLSLPFFSSSPYSLPSSVSFPPSIFSPYSLHLSSPSSFPPSLPPHDQICLGYHHLLPVSGDCYSRAGGDSARCAGMAQRPQSRQPHWCLSLRWHCPACVSHTAVTDASTIRSTSLSVHLTCAYIMSLFLLSTCLLPLPHLFLLSSPQCCWSRLFLWVRHPHPCLSRVLLRLKHAEDMPGNRAPRV